MTLGEKIKSIRKSRGLTLVEFAKAIGVSFPTLVSIEHGSRKHEPSAQTYGKLSKATGLSKIALIRLRKNERDS